MEFAYHYGPQAESYSFYQVPRVLVKGKQFKCLSAESKLLYGLFLSRMNLSAQNGWFDEEHRVYIYYKLAEIMEDINCGHDKAGKLCAELETIGLIKRKRQGLGKPDRIYVMNFTACNDNDGDNYARESSYAEPGYCEPTYCDPSYCEPSYCEPEYCEPMFPKPETDESECLISENSGSGKTENREPDCANPDANYNNTNYTEENYTYHSCRNPSIHPSYGEDFAEELPDEMDITDVEAQIKESIEYDILRETVPESKLGVFVKVMRRVLTGRYKYYRINGEMIPACEVKARFRTLDRTHIDYVLDALERSKTVVKNWFKYLLTALYNAPDTMALYYDALVRHDFGGAADYA